MKSLEDKDPDLRKIATWTLGEIGDPGAAEPLTKALKDEEPSVQTQAEEALTKLNGDDLETT
ncbi:MAG TPA: HEAT repeat domain-containing protein [Thermoanaerobacterium sp.]|nr:HEAT repeat domain-containing protein [Thermoanaerobacterium sp.]